MSVDGLTASSRRSLPDRDLRCEPSLDPCPLPSLTQTTARARSGCATATTPSSLPERSGKTHRLPPSVVIPSALSERFPSVTHKGRGITHSKWASYSNMPERAKTTPPRKTGQKDSVPCLGPGPVFVVFAAVNHHHARSSHAKIQSINARTRPAPATMNHTISFEISTTITRVSHAQRLDADRTAPRRNRAATASLPLRNRTARNRAATARDSAAPQPHGTEPLRYRPRQRRSTTTPPPTTEKQRNAKTKHQKQDNSILRA